MKIYTRTGDGGETSLIGGARVPKCDRRVAAYGDLDELNAAVGEARARLASFPELGERLVAIQRALFRAGAELATRPGRAGAERSEPLGEGDVAELERSIDAMSSELPPLGSFVLPGGSPAGAALHVARAVCRRAERSAVALAREEEVRGEILRYLNRLSDWLFVAARWANQRQGRPELPW